MTEEINSLYAVLGEKTMTIYPTQTVALSEADDNDRKILVIGAGLVGVDVVNRVEKMKFPRIKFAVVEWMDFDKPPCEAARKIWIGDSLEKLAEPKKVGRAIEKRQSQFVELMAGFKKVVLVAGMGGGLGSGAIPAIAAIVKKCGIPLAVVVSMPFRWEGKVRRRRTFYGMNRLLEITDKVFCLDDQKMMKSFSPQERICEIFCFSNGILADAVKMACFCDMGKKEDWNLTNYLKWDDAV